MQEASTFVGLDVHKNTVSVALLRPGHSAAVEWSVINDTGGIGRMIRKLEREAAGALRCCYEAGPTGFVLQRQLTRAGIDCRVIARSLIPVKPGARIKTDRRDARKLAELLRAGLLTEVKPPGTTDTSRSSGEPCAFDEESSRPSASRSPTGHCAG